MLKRVSSMLTALVMMLIMTAELPAQAFSTPKEEQAAVQTKTETVQPSVDTKTEGSVKHAYDPMAEIEKKKAEEELRKSAEIVDRTVLFTIKEKRAANSESVYLTDDSQLCKDNGLKKVEMMLETKAANEDDTYEVFYQAVVSTDDVWSVVDKLKEDSRVSNAEPDFVWKDSAVGGYTQVSAEEFSKETHFQCLNVENVWSSLSASNIKAPGYGTVVAVIDTGVDYNHKDLKDSMWVNTGEIPGNGIDDDNNGYVDDVHGYDFVENDGDPMDDHGHGTHVAGIIAMSPGNGGGVGLAYGAKIMVIKAGQATGSFASSDIAEAIKYAADNGADVINMSFGGTAKSYLVEQALKDVNSTCVLVAAAGNDGLPTTDSPFEPDEEDMYPAGYNYVLGVMATDNNGNFASFSNWDYTIGANCEYEMAAPGVAIYSTLPNDRYASWSGTSMSAPLVSAAASIIRSKYTDKSKYTSKYIMGQLVSATQRKCGAYPMLNIEDSLTKQLKPKVTLGEFYIFDDPSISAINNGDGIAQPGETIDIGVSAFNYWGIAKDVTISIDSLSMGGVANPYVEIINNSVNIGQIGTFATGNNGFTYTDGKLTGVSSPLRVKIKEGTANDIQIPINFTVTAKNGMDKTDTTVYNANGEYTVIVQNGYAISGVIDHDMTLTSDKYWIIQNSLLIPEGVTVTVEPGTQIQFWSADPANPYKDSQDVYIQVEGRFIAEGTEDRPIEMFPGKGFETFPVCICGATYYRYSSEYYLDAQNFAVNNIHSSPSFASLKYVSIMNSDSIFDDGNEEFRIDFADHCHFYCDEINRSSSDKLYINRLQKSIVENLGYNAWTEPEFVAIVSECNRFCFFNTQINTNAYWRGGPFYEAAFGNTSFINNVILNSSLMYSDQGLYNFMLYYGLNTKFEYEKYETAQPTYQNNALLSQLNTMPSDHIRMIRAQEGHNTYDISGNYWGTTDPQLVKVQCYDADWNVSLDQLVQEPYLTLDDDMSDIYPFMTEAYLTDTDNNRIDTVVGKQKVRMHVKFNRDMAQDVQPIVTYGGSEPYTDYRLKGSWVSAREWVSEFTLDPYINVGRMYIRSKGAVAADDRWLVTGEDSARFFFEVTSTSAQSMSLQGESQIGQNALTWIQDDYDTLAGYNIYRSTDYDPSVDAKRQGFEKVNQSLITAEELSFIDPDVDPDYDYYYYFTVADTGMNESKASNVVKCRPLENEKPVIEHTPVTTLRPETAITISADITDNVAVTGAELHYKNKSASEWKTVVMRNTSDSMYKATISAYEVGDEDIEYYITATDGSNVGTYGTAKKPLTIADYYVKTVSIVHQPDKLEYDIGHPLDLTGMIVAVVYNNGDVKTVTDYAVSVFDNMTEGEKTLTVSYDGVQAELQLTVTVNHIHRYDSTKTEATCTSQGKWTYVCSICGHTYEETIQKKPHDYEDKVTNPTCIEKGYTTHSCKNCDYSYIDSYTPAKGHSYKSNVQTAATCEKAGTRVYTCENCGDTYNETIKATGHKYSEKITKQATCTEDGVKTLTCVYCEDSYKEIIPATKHSYKTTVVDPTCTAKGYTLHECTKCGDSYKDTYTDAADHSFGEWVTTKAATCTSDGSQSRVCDDCGETENRKIAKLGHDYKETVVAPTCSEDGYTIHKCSRCNDFYKDTYVEHTAHTFGKWMVTTVPTCTTKGVETRKCENCAETETRTVDIVPHDYKTTVVAPTCTEKGYTLHKCSMCNDFYKDTYTESTGHKFGKWTVTTEPTCTIKGIESHKCENCDKTETREVNALGHNYTATVVSPTCTENGYTLHKCTRCGGEYKDAETLIVAHKFGEWTVTTEPTCTDKGIETRTCTYCHKTETRSVDALGSKHNYTETVVAPTCTAKGYTLHKCTRCGSEYKDNETEKLEHKFDEWKETTKPTCTQKGVETRTCPVCSTTETREVDATGHKWSDWNTTGVDVSKGTTTLTRTCSVCKKSETKTENTIKRFAGSGRFATATEISKGAFDKADTVILAYGMNSADALAGVPLANKLDAPILLTNTDKLPAETLAEIKRLGAKKVIILGGEGAISNTVKAALEKNGLKTERIAGNSRFGTATAIAEKLTSDPTEIFFVYAYNYADALSVSTAAAVNGSPIIYLRKDGEIDADTAAYLAKVKGKVKKAYVIGGEGVISNDMMNKAGKALGLKSVTRVAGTNRYATCVAVNETFKDVLNGDMICVATGTNFPDALAGGVYAAKNRAPLFLADGKLNDAQKAYLKQKKASNISIFGGQGAVPDSLVEVIVKAA